MANIIIKEINPTENALYELTEDHKQMISIKGGDCSAQFNNDHSLKSVTGCSRAELRQLRKLVKATK